MCLSVPVQKESEKQKFRYFVKFTMYRVYFVKGVNNIRKCWFDNEKNISLFFAR